MTGPGGTTGEQDEPSPEDLVDVALGLVSSRRAAVAGLRAMDAFESVYGAVPLDEGRG